MRNYSATPDLLKNRVILITGAGDGLGKAAALHYAAHGATVILLGRTIKKLEAVYDAIETAGYPQAAIYPLNLEGAGSNDYADLAENIKKEFGHLDGLLHNAAFLGAPSPAKLYDLDVWSKVLQTNLHAPYLLTRACLPLMEAADDPSIIFVTDSKLKAYWGAYGVSKAGIEGLMQILAHEYDKEEKGIRINAIDPGPLKTRLRSTAYPGEDPNSVPTVDTVLPSFLYYMGPDSQGETGKTLRLAT
ncbi:MAG: YciK family oxidoreductase [Gammaproteobacteria bacterium]|nr:YciK family oxidoreductase [Gammaproteobacteria bacterium]